MLSTRHLRSLVLPLVIAGLGAHASAQTVFTFLARANGAQEVPPVPGPGIGLGAFTIDTVANTIQLRASYANLSSAEQLAHIHGFAAPGANGGILFNLTAPQNPKCATLTYAQPQEANILAGLTYLNIHTVANGNGEIRGQIAEAPGHAYACFGDGSGTACPCGNNSVVGENEGCLSSLGTGGRLRAYGIARISGDTMVMHHSRGPDSSVLLFAGPNLISNPFGDGLRCVGGSIIRLGAKTACVGTAYWPDVTEPALSTVDSGVVAGTNRNYQTWYRNAAAFCTASTFNLSNAATVMWLP